MPVQACVWGQAMGGQIKEACLPYPLMIITTLMEEKGSLFSHFRHLWPWLFPVVLLFLPCSRIAWWLEYERTENDRKILLPTPNSSFSECYETPFPFFSTELEDFWNSLCSPRYLHFCVLSCLGCRLVIPWDKKEELTINLLVFQILVIFFNPAAIIYASESIHSVQSSLLHSLGETGCSSVPIPSYPELERASWSYFFSSTQSEDIDLPFTLFFCGPVFT